MVQPANTAFVDAAQISERHGVSRSTLSDWHRKRETTGFPKMHHNEGQKQFWDEQEIADWFAQREPESAGLVDAKQICERYGVSRGSISSWHDDRQTTGFPKVHPTAGRKQLWDEQEVADWFTQRQENTDNARRRLPKWVLEMDRTGLLTAAQVAKALGLSGVATIYGWLSGQPGYFPEPDITEPVQGRGRATKQWYAGTLIDWNEKRPGKGRRAGTNREAPPLPSVSADGDPDELLAAPAAAALLGYKSVTSFTSAVSQGLLPGLEESDDRKAGARGRPSRRWKRHRILEAGAHRGRR